MKADKRPDIDRLLAKPDPGLRLFLFYGQDEAGSRAAASALADRLAEEPGSAGRIQLSLADLRESPSRLADEAAAMSMFGGRKVVWLDQIAGAAAVQAVKGAEALLSAPVGDNPVIMLAGDLKPTHALVKLVGAARDAAALRFYLPDARQAGALAGELCKAAGLDPSREAQQALAAMILTSRAVAQREIEKYALYLDAAPDAPKTLDMAVLDRLGAAFSEGNFTDLANAVAGGDTKGAAAEHVRLLADGKASVAQVRAVQRRFVQLVELASAKPPGMPADAYLDGLGRKIFWKDKPSLTRQLSLWSVTDAERALARLNQIEIDLKSSGSAGADLTAAGGLLLIARRAAARRR